MTACQRLLSTDSFIEVSALPAQSFCVSTIFCHWLFTFCVCTGSLVVFFGLSLKWLSHDCLEVWMSAHATEDLSVIYELKSRQRNTWTDSEILDVKAAADERSHVKIYALC